MATRMPSSLLSVINGDLEPGIKAANLSSLRSNHGDVHRVDALNLRQRFCTVRSQDRSLGYEQGTPRRDVRSQKLSSCGVGGQAKVDAAILVLFLSCGYVELSQIYFATRVARVVVHRVADNHVILDRNGVAVAKHQDGLRLIVRDRKSTRLNSSHANISYAVFCLKKKNITSEADKKQDADEPPHNARAYRWP